MTTAYKDMSIEALVKLKAEIDSLIVQKKKEMKSELKKKFIEMADEAGLTLDEILTPVKEKKSVGIKYQKDSNVWSGRGRKPAWVNELEKEGEKLEDYEVKSS